MGLSDEQAVIAHRIHDELLAQRRVAQSTRRGGRPPAEMRRVLDAILWYIMTGGPWRALDQQYGSYKTAARYFLLWRDSGLLARILEAFEADLRDRGELGDVDLDDVSIDLEGVGQRRWQWHTVQVLRKARRLKLYGV